MAAVLSCELCVFPPLMSNISTDVVVIKNNYNFEHKVVFKSHCGWYLIAESKLYHTNTLNFRTSKCIRCMMSANPSASLYMRDCGVYEYLSTGNIGLCVYLLHVNTLFVCTFMCAFVHDVIFCRASRN